MAAVSPWFFTVGIRYILCSFHDSDNNVYSTTDRNLGIKMQEKCFDAKTHDTHSFLFSGYTGATTGFL